MMITTYHRPESLKEALTLLQRPNTVPLGGGTHLSKSTTEPIEVVDLQALGLNLIVRNGNEIEIGGTVTLQQLLESEECPGSLRAAIRLEAPLNLRNSATVAGTLVCCDGRSTFATCCLAFDATLTMIQGLKTGGGSPSSIMGLGEYLPLRPRGLITAITLPITKFAFEYVARTPADKPIVCAALARWNSGRTRLALGGVGTSPLLAMDGTEADGTETAARNAFHEARDAWASAEYRTEMAATLAKRCLIKIDE